MNKTTDYMNQDSDYMTIEEQKMYVKGLKAIMDQSTSHLRAFSSLSFVSVFLCFAVVYLAINYHERGNTIQKLQDKIKADSTAYVASQDTLTLDKQTNDIN